MTKLSERVPEWCGDVRDLKYGVEIGDWLKELALCFEALDQREQKESRYVRKELTRIWQNSEYTQEPKPKYEPQTYDEAIALIKGWKRCVIGDAIYWENSEAVFPRGFYGDCLISWEKNKWSDLWKEMSAEDYPGHLYYHKNVWILYYSSGYSEESTPGRVVCKAYLVYKGHPDWAERLSKHG